jgi:WD40 repeat protein
MSSSAVPLSNEIGGIASLTAAYGDGGSLAAAGGGDGGVTVWNLTRGESLASFDTEEGRVPAVSLSRLAADPVLAAAVEHEIYVWDLTGDPGGDPIHDPLTGHEATVLALDTVTFDDRLLAATGGDDATVRIWDLQAGVQVGDPLRGHKGGVETVRTAMLNGRHVVLSAGRDNNINIWDLQAAAG